MVCRDGYADRLSFGLAESHREIKAARFRVKHVWVPNNSGGVARGLPAASSHTVPVQESGGETPPELAAETAALQGFMASVCGVQPAKGESYSRKPRQAMSAALVRTMCLRRSAAHAVVVKSGCCSILTLCGPSDWEFGRPISVLSKVFIAFQMLRWPRNGAAFSDSRPIAVNVQTRLTTFASRLNDNFRSGNVQNGSKRRVIPQQALLDPVFRWANGLSWENFTAG